MTLVIANKRYSSWSLRPWLILTHFNIPFTELLIPLDQENSTNEILKHSKSGKVPALIDEGITVWESLAIAEYLNEKFPEKQMWPSHLVDRATARSISNEMHAGFQTLRSTMPHDLQKQLANFDSSIAKKDIERIFEIWHSCLKNSSGPFLFGSFSIADAMYAPVVNRFISYGVTTDSTIKKYMTAIRDLSAHKAWINSAMGEKMQMTRYK